MQKMIRWSLSLLLGLAVGAIIHYSLYRIGLPLQPFIYMAF